MSELKPYRPDHLEHVVVYRQDNAFCSWPFNAGMWRVDEQQLLVGFMHIACNYAYPLHLKHSRVEAFGQIKAARSQDGGYTWAAATDIANNLLERDALLHEPAPVWTADYDFASPHTLLSCWTTPNSGHPQAQAWIKLSGDGGASWSPAAMLPDCGIPRYQGRPSYVVRPDGVILLFLTAQPHTNPYDRPVVFASFDHGHNWTLMSFMPGSSEYRVICPAPVQLPDGRIVVAVRCKPAMIAAWNEIYVSEDGGRGWQLLSRVNDHGDTADLQLLADGRLFIAYGYRRPPFGLRGRISEDGGRTWGPELILRDNGGSRDLGYPRVTEMTPGHLVISYYMNDREDPIQQNGGVRYIAATHLSL